MKTKVHTKQRAYPVIVERGSLYHIAELVGKCGTPYIVSDDGVPEKWRNALIEQYPDASVFVFKNGEQSKNIYALKAILTDMLKRNISRSDTLIALGGGVVGYMAGFAAAIYMRGIRYVNIPTTTVSQIDSCIGGKTAIDLAGIKNSVGAFWQPSMVIADPDTLATLSARHFHNGLAEAVKSELIQDKKLFEIFEADDYSDPLDEIIERSLLVKKTL